MSFDFNFLSNTGGTSPAPIFYTYVTADTRAAMLVAGYFNNAYTKLKVNDLIVAVNDTETTSFRVTAIGVRSVTVQVEGISPPVDNCRIGFADYNDLASQTVAINITGGGGFVDLPNDALGPQTIKTFLPDGVTDIWDADNDVFDWSELKLGDMVDIRLDLTLITASTNTDIDVELSLGTGGGVYSIPFISQKPFKVIGTYGVNNFNGIYLGDANTLNNGGKFRIKSDKTCTVKVNGWYCKVLING